MSDIQIHDYGQAEPPEGQQVWTTDQMQEVFEVHEFAAPYVFVTRRSDGVQGTLEFTHKPRFYFGFKEAT